MKPYAFVVTLLAGLCSVGTVSAASIELDGIGLSQEVPCGGKDVNITGSENRIRLTGSCGAVVVYGTDHVVTLATASSLEVSGIQHNVVADSVERLTVDTNKNRVRTAVAGHGRPATVEVLGAEHELDLRFEGPVTVALDGIDSRLQWSGDEPSLSSSGSGNEVEQR